MFSKIYLIAGEEEFSKIIHFQILKLKKEKNITPLTETGHFSQTAKLIKCIYNYIILLLPL